MARFTLSRLWTLVVVVTASLVGPIACSGFVASGGDLGPTVAQQSPSSSARAWRKPNRDGNELQKGWIIGHGGVWHFPFTGDTSGVFPYGANQVPKKAPLELLADDSNPTGFQFQVPAGYTIVWYAAMSQSVGCDGGYNIFKAVGKGTGEAEIKGAHFEERAEFTLFIYNGEQQDYPLLETIALGTPKKKRLAFATPFENTTIQCNLWLLLGYQ